jgi:hypothetical protein
VKRLSTQITSFFRLADSRHREAGLWPRHGRQLAIALFFCVAAVLMFPRGESFEFADLREGDIYIGEQIIAPFTFSINKSPEEYDLDVKEARARVYPVFVRSDSAAQLHLQQLTDFFVVIEPTLKSLLPDSLKMRYLREQFVNQKIVITTESLQSLVQMPLYGQKNSGFADFRRHLQRIATDVFFIGILSVTKSNLAAATRRIAVRDRGDEMVGDLANFYDLESVKDVALQKLRDAMGNNEIGVKAGYVILTPLLRPNLFYDAAETQRRADLAATQVPLARGTVLKEERIIGSNEKITSEHIQKLRSLAAEKAAREGDDGGVGDILPYLGRFFIAVLAIGFLSVFVWSARPRLYEDISQVFLIAITLLLVLGAAFLLRQAEADEYLIPIALASLLLTVFFDYQLAFAGTVSLSLLLGGMTGNQFGISFITVVVGAMSIAAVSRVRSRSWIFKAILFIFVGYVFAICAIGFVRKSPLSEMAMAWFYGGINALLCPVLSYGLLVILEYLFDVTTDATLLELSDLNRPLLREFAMQAPGSYHHSILVGTLSEAAAEAIGANSLLARVGAYYHDIGKMDMPEYFVENQRGGKNPHEKLTPSMSYLIIINHVKRGLELAEENRLPKDIRDFIPQHHGTNLLTYFYKKALERTEDTEVHESDFRYPGPKPQSKETGIVMLADAVEAAARALRDPSVSRLRNVVNTIVEERFKQGELDECPLTLRDLNLIKESFERTLSGVFHGRVKYAEGEPATATRGSRASRDQSPSSLSSESEAPAVLP